MEPRFVTLQSTYFLSTDSGAGYGPPSSQIISARTSWLYDISSDNIKRRRPQSPAGRLGARRNYFRATFATDPKKHTYTLQRDINPLGNFVYGSGNPSNYPKYKVQGGQPPRINYPTAGDKDWGLLSQADKKIKSKFFGKLKNTELDLSITLAEGAKTKVMMVKRAQVLLNLKNFLRSFWKRVRQRSIKRHESIAVAMSNAWLEFWYGWRQVANDLYAIAAYNYSDSLKRLVKVRSFTVNQSRATERDPYSGITTSYLRTNSIRSEMKVSLSVSANPSVDLSRMASLNPLAIAWELLPLSFVFDWLFDLSRLLQELQTRVTFASSFVGGYVNHTLKQEVTGFIPSQQARGTLWCDIEQGIKYSRTTVFKDRSLLTTMPWPGLPVLKNPVNLTHTLTTIALVAQRMSASQLGRKAKYL